MERRVTPTALRLAIARLGYTQAQFAARLGVDRSTVVRWLEGRPMPHMAELAIRYLLLDLRVD
jgi:transcriptional regulator with XRE-family HTH domain